MGTGLSVAKVKLELDINNAFKDALEAAFKSTFIYSGGAEGDEIAKKFAQEGAQKASKPIAEAIYNFVSNAKITGQNALVSTIVAPPMTGGPCTGVLAFNGTELSLM